MSKIFEIAQDRDLPESIRIYLNDIIEEFDSGSSRAWQQEVTSKTSEHHRTILLNRGRADFDSPPNGLTAEELVLLYNYYYMPMHLISSFWLYNQIFKKEYSLPLINRTPIFFDWGCGTFASCLAFAAASQKPRKKNKNENEIIDVCYYGVDRSEGMLEAVKRLLNRQFDLSRSQEINDTKSIIWNSVVKVLDFLPLRVETVITDSFFLGYGAPSDDLIKSIYANRQNVLQNLEGFVTGNKKNPGTNLELDFIQSEFALIINFSYLFASHSLDPLELGIELNKLLITYNKLPVYFIFQNPNVEDLNVKWDSFKLLFNQFTQIEFGVEPIKHFGYSKVKYEVLYKPAEVLFHGSKKLMAISGSNNKNDMILQFKNLYMDALSNPEKQYVIGYGMSSKDIHSPPQGLTHDDMIEIFIQAGLDNNGTVHIPTNLRFSELYARLLNERARNDSTEDDFDF